MKQEPNSAADCGDCPLLPLRQSSISLIQQYARYSKSEVPSDSIVIERVRDTWVLLLNEDEGHKNGTNNNYPSQQYNMKYKCLANGGFLRPTVIKHPCWNAVKTMIQKSKKKTKVLDLGCGLGGDARVMKMELSTALSNEAVQVVGVDYSSFYLKLGYHLFADNVNEFSKSIKFLHVDASSTSFTETFQDKIGFEVRSGFDVIYAGKFLHCFDSHEQVKIVVSNVNTILSNKSGVFLGVFARNPPWIYGDRLDFEELMTGEGFRVLLLKEEEAGATWFAVAKK